MTQLPGNMPSEPRGAIPPPVPRRAYPLGYASSPQPRARTPLLSLQIIVGVISVFAALSVAGYMVVGLGLPPESLWLLVVAFIVTLVMLHARKGWYGLTIGVLLGIALIPLIGIVGLLVICGGH